MNTIGRTTHVYKTFNDHKYPRKHIQTRTYNNHNWIKDGLISVDGPL